MKQLKKFINEELTWNYWMRRPRNNQVRGAGPEIEATRRKQFDEIVLEFDKAIKDVIHLVKSSATIEDLENALERCGIDAYDVVADITVFDNAASEKDVIEARRQIIIGLPKWKIEMIKGCRQNGYDTGILQQFINQGGNFSKPFENQ